MFLRDLTHQFGEIYEIGVGQRELAQRIAESRIESGGNKNQVGLECIRGRQKHLLKRAQNISAARSRRERNVKRAVLASTFAALRTCSRAGIPRRLMRAEEQSRSVCVEDILRAVAVMHIP